MENTTDRQARNTVTAMAAGARVVRQRRGAQSAANRLKAVAPSSKQKCSKPLHPGPERTPATGQEPPERVHGREEPVAESVIATAPSQASQTPRQKNKGRVSGRGRFRAKQKATEEDGHLGWGWRLAGAEGGRVVAFGASGSGRMQRAGRRTGGQARCAASAQCPSCLPAHGPAAIRDNPARPAWQMRRTPSGGGRSSTTPSSTLRLLSRRRVFTCAETLSGCSLSKWPSMSTKSSDGGREGVCGVTLKGPAGLWSVDVMDLPIS